MDLDRLQLLEEDRPQLSAAAQPLARAQEKDVLIHVFGTEPTQSALISKIFFRPGALLNINPVLDPALDIAHSAYRDALRLPLDGFAPCVLDYYEYVQADDSILLSGSHTDLPMFVQALEWVKAKGLKTITVLAEGYKCVADIVLHNYCPYDCAAQQVDTVLFGGMKTAPTAALLHLLMLETLSLLPNAQEHTWSGQHFVDLEANMPKIEKMLYRISHL